MLYTAIFNSLKIFHNGIHLKYKENFTKTKMCSEFSVTNCAYTWLTLLLITVIGKNSEFPTKINTRGHFPDLKSIPVPYVYIMDRH